MPLKDYLPSGPVTADILLEHFLEYAASRELSLYPAQESALLEIFDGKNVILNTPTGSGKSLVAAALHFESLARGKRSVYTCPIKALVNEKWMALCQEFGAEHVGLSTGDATVHQDAPILCCTAEILANIALREGRAAPFADVVMDEFHYYSDRERGVAWQSAMLCLPQSRFLLMSATLGDTMFFEEELARITGKPAVTIRSEHRPVPLEFGYQETPLAQTIERLVQERRTPVYVVHFTQMEAAQSAQDFTSINVCSREEKAILSRAIDEFRFSSPYGAEIKRWLRHGIGLHHAGLLPKYRVLAEQLAQRGLLQVICGTDTLGVGINVPIRTVLFTRLCKFDGEKTAILSARDFHQIAGRAGRKGFDSLGWVLAQAPEHVIENLKLEEKAARDGKKTVKRKAPEKNFVAWDRQTFQRLQQSPPERLVSRFQVSHGMLLNVLSRPGDGCFEMRSLIRQCHDSPKQKKAHFRRAWQLFRSLVERGIVSPSPEVQARSQWRISVELQDDFSMNQSLSLYLFETLPKLDAASPNHTFDVLSLVESILEDPEPILRRQLDRLKSEKLAEMKRAGVDYDERMEELEKLEHPKPNREFIYATFNEFAKRHPWVGEENIRPKSIAREMFEQFRSFDDYVKDYELQRVEGLLLRHLSSVHKVLAQTVPDVLKTDSLREVEIYLLALIRGVDSSLLEEWEKMQRGASMAPSTQPPPALPPRPESNSNRLRAELRQIVFQFLRALSNSEFVLALELTPAASVPGQPDWNPESLRVALDRYRQVRGRFRLDPEARNLKHTHFLQGDQNSRLTIEQVLIDPDEHNDWIVAFEVEMGGIPPKDSASVRFRDLRPLLTP